MKYIKLFIVVLLLCSTFTNYAQRTKPTTTLYAKFKAPKLIASLGGYKDSSFISPVIADAIVGAKLNVIDTKNVAYTLSSYQFLYKKIVVSENEETGKPYNTTSIKSSLFKVSPLPDMWLSAVRENLRPGEEIIFFDIIVKDAQGRFMYAPNLKLMVK